ncbi:MAG: SDR family oxidoreductase [Polyangiaceae bacterium]|nr:SDR family oxidoreductase [Polyangiaceae bacterium]
MTFDFQGKTVFVAGGTSGINLGIALGFAEAGAKVAVLSRSQDKVDAAIGKLKAARSGAEAIGFAADVREHPAVEAALAKTKETFGTIDVLVSGAAGNFPAPAVGISPKGFKSVVEIDLLGTFHVLRSALPHMAQPGGSIINITAPQSYVAMEMQMHVCAAKAGVDMVTRVAALEWGPLGVRVNSISPGPIAETEGMSRLAPTEDLKNAVLDTVPLKRFGAARDIANACMWLASPMASYVTGAVIPVDGGWGLGGASVSVAAMKKALMG